MLIPNQPRPLETEGSGPPVANPNIGWPFPNTGANQQFPAFPPNQGMLPQPTSGPGYPTNPSWVPTPQDATDPTKMAGVPSVINDSRLRAGGVVLRSIAGAQQGTGNLGVPQSYLLQDQGMMAGSPTPVAPAAAASAPASNPMLAYLALRGGLGSGLSDMMAQAIQTQQQPAQNPLQGQMPTPPPGAMMPFARPLR